MTDIKVVISPSDASDKSFTIVSSTPEVVSVDKDNKCSALAEGEATLTITTTDGGFTAECKVVVKAATVKVEGVSVDPSEQDVTVGDTFTVGQ